MALGIALVFRRVGFVEERPTGRESRGQGRKLIAQQAPDNKDEIEGLFRRPCQGFFRRLPSKRQDEPSLIGTLACKEKAFVRNVGESRLPATVREPQGMASRAACQIEGAARAQTRADLSYEPIRFNGLGFTAEEFGIPA